MKRPGHRAGRWIPVAVPAALAAGAVALGHPTRAAALAAVALGAAIAVAAGVPVARLVERAAETLARWFAVVAFGLVGLIAIVPAWTWRKIRRAKGVGPASSGWQPTRTDVIHPDGRGNARTRSRWRVPTLVGMAVIVLAADYGLGWSWDQVFAARPVPGSASAPTAPTTSVPVSGETDLAPGTEPDPRATAPAMAGAPWAARYFADLQRQPFGYWPLIGSHPEDLATPYINVEDWVRRSWAPPGPAAARPQIWFFGGSAMFGEGQRDEHTIPSEVARLAEADGLPVRVLNFGQRGWVHWQEMLLFEQQLAGRPRPAIAVFLDGPNDLESVGAFPDNVPNTRNPTKEDAENGGPRALVTTVLAPPAPSLVEQVRAAYEQHSAVRKIARWTGVLPEPAGAEPDPTTTTTTPGGTGTFAGVDDVRPAITIYRRGRDLTDHIAEGAGVPVEHFLQPQYYKDLPVWTYVRENWPGPTTDLSDAMGDEADAVYLDGVHTNERGAHLVAEAMWARLRPTVRTWYRTHD